MKKLFIMLSLIFGFFFIFASAACIRNDAGFIECTQERNISLDEVVGQDVNLDQIVLNLSDMSIDAPVECVSDFCYEESSVVVKVKKI